MAASATSVKSLRNASVEGCLSCEGGGAGTEAIWFGDVRTDDAVDEAVACDGDEIGAFIVIFVCLLREYM